MSQRAPLLRPPAPRDDARSAKEQAEQVLRRRLEGRLECLEAATARTRALARLLGRRRWEQELRAQPTLVELLLAAEPDVEEALDRVRRRAAVEGWGGGHLALVRVRELTGARGQLLARVTKRLRKRSAARAPESLVQGLTTLVALVEEVQPPLPREGTPLRPGALPRGALQWVGFLVAFALLPLMVSAFRRPLALPLAALLALVTSRLVLRLLAGRR